MRFLFWMRPWSSLCDKRSKQHEAEHDKHVSGPALLLPPRFWAGCSLQKLSMGLVRGKEKHTITYMPGGTDSVGRDHADY